MLYIKAIITEVGLATKIGLFINIDTSIMSGTEAHNKGKEVLSTIYCTIDVDSTHRELPRVVCVDEKLYTPEALRPWHPVRSVPNRLSIVIPKAVRNDKAENGNKVT
jgi:hypothetical protein